MLADRQQRRTLRLLVGRQRLPFRSAYGSEQNRVAGFTGRHRFRRQGLAHRINRCAAHQLRIVAEGHARLDGDVIQHLEGFLHHLRANAIARQHCDFITAAHSIEWPSCMARIAGGASALWRRSPWTTCPFSSSPAPSLRPPWPAPLSTRAAAAPCASPA